MKLTHRLCMFLSLALAATAATAQHEGHDHSTAKFEDLNPKQSAATMPPLVMEFFWYGCSHCYKAEPKVQQWLKNKPDKVKFIRVPAVMARHWIPHAQAYFAAERLGVLDKIHEPLFTAIHRDKKSLFAQEELAEFIGAAAGVDPVKVLVEMQSKVTEQQLRETFNLARLHRLTGVPAFIVGGKYKTGSAMAGDDVMNVIDELLAKRKD